MRPCRARSCTILDDALGMREVAGVWPAQVAALVECVDGWQEVQRMTSSLQRWHNLRDFSCVDECTRMGAPPLPTLPSLQLHEQHVLHPLPCSSCD